MHPLPCLRQGGVPPSQLTSALIQHLSCPAQPFNTLQHPQHLNTSAPQPAPARAGLRRINLAYSRISLAEVAAKLQLASAEDAECIVAKAIRDGGIDATIDHAGGFIQSKESVDVYSTQEPQQVGVLAEHATILNMFKS